MSVDGGAGHAKEVGDLLDGLLPGVIELLSKSSLVGAEAGPATSDSAAGAGGREAVAGVGDDQLALELADEEQRNRKSR